jgi:predicted RNA-binding Zn ribbon-like protein
MIKTRRQVGVPSQPFGSPEARLCLDFANTVSWRGAVRPTERLPTYADLVAWLRQARLVSDREVNRLPHPMQGDGGKARRFFRRAIQLRELIFRLFASVCAGEDPSPTDLATLNDWLSRALSHARIQATPAGLVWTWTFVKDPLATALWTIARSAADLLTSQDSSRIRQCAGKDCRWLFLDTTRNRSRRWCEMAVCGNRAKAARHRHRTASIS